MPAEIKTRGRKYKWLRRSLRIILLLFILLNIMAAFHAWKLTHNRPVPSADLRGPEKMSVPEKLKALFLGVWSAKTPVDAYPSVPYDTIELITSNKLKIEGWLIKKDSARGTVILFHGHMGNKGATLPEATLLRELGYNTLLIDFRAHGNSEGEACTIGRKEAEDVKLAYDYVKVSGEENIILWGTSMGAAAICGAINDYSLAPAGVILEMPFGSLKNAVEGRVKMMGLPREPISALLTFWGGVEQGFNAFGYQPRLYAKKISSPALLQWGALDKRVTRRETDAIFRNLASAHKQLQVYPQAAHASLLKSDSLLWRNTVNDFLNRKR
jgi:uncharacterized protein